MASILEAEVGKREMSGGSLGVGATIELEAEANGSPGLQWLHSDGAQACHLAAVLPTWHYRCYL